MAQRAEPSEFEYLRARAQVARLLVRQGALAPESALAFAVWPTPKMEQAEQRVNRFTIAARAYSPRLNS